jgi:hypothetical protein
LRRGKEAQTVSDELLGAAATTKRAFAKRIAQPVVAEKD